MGIHPRAVCYYGIKVEESPDFVWEIDKELSKVLKKYGMSYAVIDYGGVYDFVFGFSMGVAEYGQLFGRDILLTDVAEHGLARYQNSILEAKKELLKILKSSETFNGFNCRSEDVELFISSVVHSKKPDFVLCSYSG